MIIKDLNLKAIHNISDYFATRHMLSMIIKDLNLKAIHNTDTHATSTRQVVNDHQRSESESNSQLILPLRQNPASCQ